MFVLDFGVDGMGKSNRLLRTTLIAAAVVSTIFGIPAATNAQQRASTAIKVQDNAFGVLGRMAGTFWGERAETAFEWVSVGEILSHEVIMPDGTVVRNEIRRSLDGRSLLGRIVGTDQRAVITFPSNDSFQYLSEGGSFFFGCRLTADERMLMCETADESGARIPYEAPRSTAQARQETLSQAAAKRDTSEGIRKAAIAAASKIWGSALVEASTTWNGTQLVWHRKDYVVVRQKIGEAPVRWVMQLGWSNDSNGQIQLVESTDEVDGNFYDWFTWKVNPKNGELVREAARGYSNSLSVNSSGRLNGPYRLYGVKKNMEMFRIKDGLLLIERDQAGRVTWSQHMLEAPAGTYDEIHGRNFEVWREKRARPGLFETVLGFAAQAASAAAEGYVQGSNGHGGASGRPDLSSSAPEQLAARSGQTNEGEIRTASASAQATNPIEAPPMVALPQTALRYFSCVTTRWGRISDGSTAILSHSYGVVTSKLNTDETSARFRERTGARGVDGENSGGGCFPEESRSDADFRIEAAIARNRKGPSRITHHTYQNFSF